MKRRENDGHSQIQPVCEPIFTAPPRLHTSAGNCYTHGIGQETMCMDVRSHEVDSDGLAKPCGMWGECCPVPEEASVTFGMQIQPSDDAVETMEVSMKGIFVCTLLLLLSPPAVGEDILIGTGSKSGVYHQVGRAMCRLIHRQTPDLSCAAKSTPSSVFSLANVRSGALEMAIVQSDLQYYAVNRRGSFEFVDISYGNIRSLFSLYGEPLTLLVRRDSGIRTLEDLKGRRVNIGNPGSEQRITMDVVMKAKGWSKKDFQLATELPAAQQSLALCHNRVQATVYTVGHPNPSISKAARQCDAAIAEVSGPAIEKIVSANPYYVQTIIPGGMYRGMDKPVETFGVVSTVVSSSDIDDDLIYQVVKNVFEQLDDFRRMHTAFGQLRSESMIKSGLSAPLHEGAKRYYREQGWMIGD